MTAFAKDKDTKENKPTIDGIIKTYSQNATIPAETYGASVPFQIMNEPEAAIYNKYIVLSFAQYTESGTSQYLSSFYVGGTNQTRAVPALIIGEYQGQDLINIQGFNASESDKTYKFEIKVLWYND